MGTTPTRSATWRLRQVKRTDNQALIAEYRYNGLGYRLSWKYDTDGDTDVDGSDQTYFFVYDLKWRPVATYRGTDANPKERFIFHNAGLGGRGGSSYIDAVIMRDRDANAGWTAASDATLEERRYYCQNWRADVVALLSGDGAVSEWVRYSAYGEATVYPFENGDYNADGGVDGGDTTAFLTDQDNSANAADVDRSGAVDGDDVTAFYASWDNDWSSTAWTSGGGLPARAGQLSVTSGNRIGYAGYQFDPATEQYHVRHRVYSPEMGRWTRRDPLGYVDGMGLMEYVGGRAVGRADPNGLRATGCGSCSSSLGAKVIANIDYRDDYYCVTRSTSVAACMACCSSIHPYNDVGQGVRCIERCDRTTSCHFQYSRCTEGAWRDFVAHRDAIGIDWTDELQTCLDEAINQFTAIDRFLVQVREGCIASAWDLYPTDSISDRLARMVQTRLCWAAYWEQAGLAYAAYFSAWGGCAGIDSTFRGGELLRYYYEYLRELEECKGARTRCLEGTLSDDPNYVRPTPIVIPRPPEFPEMT